MTEAAQDTAHYPMRPEITTGTIVMNGNTFGVVSCSCGHEERCSPPPYAHRLANEHRWEHLEDAVYGPKEAPDA